MIAHTHFVFAGVAFLVMMHVEKEILNLGKNPCCPTPGNACWKNELTLSCT